MYIPTCLANAGLPHSAFGGGVWRRQAGDFQLLVIAGKDSRIPCGSYARLFFMWLVTQVILLKKQTIKTNDSLHSILKSLGLNTDGKTRRRFKDQAARFLSCSMSMFRLSAGATDAVHQICSAFDLQWNHRLPDNPSFFDSTFLISDAFFDHIMASAFPVKKEAVIAMRQSPFCLDIYPWLSHRMSYNRQDTRISFDSLENQFGSAFNRPADFKRSFRHHLQTVSAHYPEALTSFYPTGLILHPSPTAVPRMAPQ